jgi:hypothetical protein
MNVPLLKNAGVRCLALERTNSNPQRPTLLNVFTSFNAAGTQLDSVGIYEYNPANCAIIHRFLIPENYNLRGIEYDPRDGTLWASVLEQAAGGPYNYMIKYTGFYSPTGVAEEIAQPRGIANLNCYPNPFRNSITISYQLRKTTEVQVSIHDASGRVVASLSNTRLAAGAHTVSWTQKGVAGVYFVSVRTPEENRYHKVIKF